MKAKVVHPGLRIKSEVIPRGMSVTEAAKLIGVGRPALSNLLNGKSSLSVEMAVRIEKAFNFPLKILMEMQADYDHYIAGELTRPSDVRSFVAPYLGIKANQIEHWADRNISARTRLAVLLRTLVSSTDEAIITINFPGNDDAERPGWDGFVETREGNPWVPAGRSGWEFGTNEDPKAKADGDFHKSVKAVKNKAERGEITFVFVTPRRWVGKAKWVSSKKSTGQWKDVRAYDASDVEQWLEQSIPAQAWLANEIGIPTRDVRSLDRCWRDWADVSQPALTGTFFDTAIEVAKKVIHPWLIKPVDKPLIISADSAEEALAFLSQLFGERGGSEIAAFRERVLVFDKPGSLAAIAQGAPMLIPVVFTRQVERELGPCSGSIHSISIYPRNAVNVEPDVVLEPLRHESFSKALAEIGKGRDEIERLANESGRSLTVLRRRMTSVNAVRLPEWAADQNAAAELVPFMLVGAWHSGSEADKQGLSLLARDRRYEELEKDFRQLALLNDAPVWSLGNHRGVVSKIDLLYAIANAVTVDDLAGC